MPAEFKQEVGIKAERERNLLARRRGRTNAFVGFVREPFVDQLFANPDSTGEIRDGPSAHVQFSTNEVVKRHLHLTAGASVARHLTNSQGALTIARVGLYGQCVRPQPYAPLMKLRRVIHSAGYRFDWFARQLGIQPDHFNHMLAGRKRPRPGMLARAAEILGVPLEDISPFDNGGDLAA